MQFTRLTFIRALSAIIFVTVPSLRLFAQVPSPNSDPSTAMTVDLGEAITDTDEPNNQDVPADSNYTQPEGPYAPELPDTGGNYEGPVGVSGIFNGNVTTGCSYDPLSHSAHRAIDDIVVPGSIGKYPLKMTRYYNSRAVATSLGPEWRHEYLWSLGSNNGKIQYPNGNVWENHCESPVGVSDWTGPLDPYGNPTFRLADGGTVVFTVLHP